MLVLGGTRSGKSEYAERMAARASGTVTYVATGIATDDDMAARIARHQARRPDSWATAEVGTDLPRRLAAIQGLALVDSLGTWVAACRDLTPDIAGLCDVLQARTSPTIVVSEEVGLGVHAPTEVGRVFTDALGDLNRAVADIAEVVLLVVAGRALRLTSADELTLPRLPAPAIPDPPPGAPASTGPEPAAAPSPVPPAPSPTSPVPPEAPSPSFPAPAPPGAAGGGGW